MGKENRSELPNELNVLGVVDHDAMEGTSLTDLRKNHSNGEEHVFAEKIFFSGANGDSACDRDKMMIEIKIEDEDFPIKKDNIPQTPHFSLDVPALDVVNVIGHDAIGGTSLSDKVSLEGGTHFKPPINDLTEGQCNAESTMTKISNKKRKGMQIPQKDLNGDDSFRKKKSNDGDLDLESKCIIEEHVFAENTSSRCTNGDSACDDNKMMTEIKNVDFDVTIKKGNISQIPSFSLDVPPLNVVSVIDHGSAVGTSLTSTTSLDGAMCLKPPTNDGFELDLTDRQQNVILTKRQKIVQNSLKDLNEDSLLRKNKSSEGVLSLESESVEGEHDFIENTSSSVYVDAKNLHEGNEYSLEHNSGSKSPYETENGLGLGLHPQPSFLDRTHDDFSGSQSVDKQVFLTSIAGGPIPEHIDTKHEDHVPIGHVTSPKDLAEGNASGNVLVNLALNCKHQTGNEDEGTNSNSNARKVDKSGRLIGEDANVSNFGDSRYARGQNGKSKSRSRSQSPLDRNACEFGTGNMRQDRGQKPNCYDFSRGWCYRGLLCHYQHHNSEKSDVSRQHNSYQQWQYEMRQRPAAGEFSTGNMRRDRDQKSDCYDFIRGKCSRGASCRYRHHDSENSDESRQHKSYHQWQYEMGKRPEAGEFSNGKMLHDRGQREDCRDFSRGRCYRGELCRYWHHESENNDGSRQYKSYHQWQYGMGQRPEAGEFSTCNMRQDIGQKADCFDYSRGWCHRGTICPYRHNDPEKSDGLRQHKSYHQWQYEMGKRPEAGEFSIGKMRHDGGEREDCRNYSRGRCYRGTTCPYRHNDSEKSDGSRQQKSYHQWQYEIGKRSEAGEFSTGMIRQDGGQKADCFDFSRGRCYRGTICPYQHNNSQSNGSRQCMSYHQWQYEQGKRPEAGESSTGIFRLNICQKADCFDFSRGRCYRGDICPYRHHDSERNDGSLQHKSYQQLPNSYTCKEIMKMSLKISDCDHGQEMQLSNNMPPSSINAVQYNITNGSSELDLKEVHSNVTLASTELSSERQKSVQNTEKDLNSDTSLRKNKSNEGDLNAESESIECEHVSTTNTSSSCANGNSACDENKMNYEIKNATIGVPVKDDYIPTVPHNSLKGPHIQLADKKLLILDVNGLLVDIVAYVSYGFTPDTTISMKSVFKRPHCDDFLQFCFEKFNVGVWSSRSKKNVDMVVDFLMADFRHKLLFCWDQSHCTDTGYTTVENPNKPLVLKELKKLWENLLDGLPWKKGEYNESNTLLLDDSPYKALRNPAHTAIFPRSYRYKDKEDFSLGPGGDLRVYLERLAEAQNVQEFVAQNPFGQRAITESNPSWGFYSKIVSMNSSDSQDVASSFCHLLANH